MKELICWITGLLLLYCMDPHEHHFTLCPLGHMGFQWCPGCGLGRSIALLMHGELAASWRMHWLGVPALLVIGHRIYILLRQCCLNWRRSSLKIIRETLLP